jgi:rod shape determining protein RodA
MLSTRPFGDTLTSGCGAVLLILTAYGILMIRSAVTGAPALEPWPGSNYNGPLLVLWFMIAMAAIDYRYFASSHWYIYAALILSPSHCDHGRAGQQRGPPLDQPRLHRNSAVRIRPCLYGHHLRPVPGQPQTASSTALATPSSRLAYMGLPIVLIFLQPDLGMSVLYRLHLVHHDLAGRVTPLPLRHVGAFGILGIGAWFPFLAPYQQERITSFVSPEAADTASVFNVNQAEISIGTGGLWGKGYMQGTQSQLGFLRVQHTDFIFSMLTEEMGLFFGSAVVLLLMGFILLRIIRIAAAMTPIRPASLCVPALPVSSSSKRWSTSA